MVNPMAIVHTRTRWLSPEEGERIGRLTPEQERDRLQHDAVVRAALERRLALERARHGEFDPLEDDDV
jgi:hypothetical protein